MTNIETNVTNSAETILDGPLPVGATSISVVDGSAFPAVPFYATIDPGNDAAREIVLVDGTKTASTFTLTTVANRGVDGTSEVAHDSGTIIAIVPVAATWTDINDRVDAGEAGTTGVASDLADHEAASNPHSGSASTSALTTHTSAGNPHSDSASNASVTAVATDLSDHEVLEAAHNSTTGAVASRMVRRDASGRSQFSNPAVALDAANKSYVDGAVARTYAGITRTTAQSIPDGAITQITFTATASENPTSFGDHVNNQLIVPATGFYLVGTFVRWSSSAVDKLLYIYVNGSVTGIGHGVPSLAGALRMSAVGALQLGSGDLITARVNQVSGSSLNLSEAHLWAMRLDA